jgi:DNA-binding NarL/FixJ family response regulator
MADKDRRRLDRGKGCARRLERGAESSVGGMYTPPAAREVSANFIPIEIPIEYGIQNKFLEYRVTTITIIAVVRYVCTKARGQGATGGSGALRNMVRILLADGQAVVRRGLRILLDARPDFEVCAEASTGCEAVELALRHRPDVSILDISLPLVSGAEATRQIRKAAPETEVMIFTLQNGESEIRDVLHAGARGYVLKSENDETIVRAVTALALHHTYFSDQVSKILLDNFFEQTASEHKAHSLTARERKVVQLIAEGNSNKRTALLLSISVKTVETHRSASMRKLDIHTTAQLVRYAFREGLVQP